MRLTPFMAAAFLPAASSAAQPPAPAQAPAPAASLPPVAAPPSLGTGTCVRDLRREAQGGRVEGLRLGELPAGDLQFAIVREVDGCPEPTIVRQGFGAARGERR